MTRSQRAQVVELLRCAADVCSIVRAGYDTGYCDGINPCSPVFSLAREAYFAASGYPDSWSANQHSCLEAALRVEQGEWP